MPTGTFSRLEIEAFIDELVGPPVEVNDRVIRTCQETGAFGGLSFDLLNETTMLMYAVSEYRSATGEDLYLTRNQAVCAGLIIRISKMMMSILKLSSGYEHGETVSVLCRCVFESSINVRYLLQQNRDALYERFVRVGLNGEKSLYDAITSNIEERGGVVLGIEASMLESINRTCQGSGVDIEDVNPKAGEWGGSFRDKLDALGIQRGAYSLQAMASQSVHGSWSDLVRNHLSIEESGYRVDTDHKPTNGKFLGPVAVFALGAAIPYLDESFDREESEPFRRRLEDLLARIQKVEDARPEWEPSGD